MSTGVYRLGAFALGLSLIGSLRGEASSPAETWASSVEKGGTRYFTYSAPVVLLGKSTDIKVIFYCNPMRGKNENGALGIDVHISKIAALAPFAFADFEGPDASVPGKPMRITISRAGQPDLTFNVAPNGGSPNGDDFMFGFAEMSHVAVSDPKSILKALGAGADEIRIVITDPRKPTLKLEMSVPVSGTQAGFQSLLAGVK